MPKYILLTTDVAARIGKYELIAYSGLTEGEVRDSEMCADEHWSPYICGNCEKSFHFVIDTCKSCGERDLYQQRYCTNCRHVERYAKGSPASQNAILPCTVCGKKTSIAIGTRVISCSVHNCTYPTTLFYAKHDVTPECRLGTHEFSPRKYPAVLDVKPK